MKNLMAKIKAFIKLITPWIKFGLDEYRHVKEEIKKAKAEQKKYK